MNIPDRVLSVMVWTPPISVAGIACRIRKLQLGRMVNSDGSGDEQVLHRPRTTDGQESPQTKEFDQCVNLIIVTRSRRFNG